MAKDESSWVPVITLRSLLLAVVKRMGVENADSRGLFASLATSVAPALERELSVAYIAVGCGGPFLDQQLPRSVQLMRQERQGLCLLVMIDPLLTYPETNARLWNVEHDDHAMTMLCVCNGQVKASDMASLEAFITDVSRAGLSPDRIIVADYRGAAYAGAPYPIVEHLAIPVAEKCCNGALQSDVDDKQDVSLDASAQLVLRVVHGLSCDSPDSREVISLMARRDAPKGISYMKLLEGTPKASWPPDWTDRDVSLLLQLDHQRTMARLQGSFAGGLRGLLNEARQFLRPLR